MRRCAPVRDLARPAHGGCGSRLSDRSVHGPARSAVNLPSPTSRSVLGSRPGAVALVSTPVYCSTTNCDFGLT
jgi:hypothetical protein